jgi:membrane fusion protein, heavy metal efflux system
MNRAPRAWNRALVLLLVGLLGIGVGYWLGSSRTAEPKPADPPKPAKEVAAKKEGGDGGPIVLSAEQKDLLKLQIEPAVLGYAEETLAATGRISVNPDRTVIIAPRSAGRVVKIMARLGQTVRPGEVLALLDSLEAADAMAELAQNESALALAQARADKEKQLYDAKLRVLETVGRQEGAAAAERTLAQVEVGRLKQEYIAALARLELARANYDRQQLLVEKKIGARKDLIEAEKGLIAARGEVDAVAETIRITARQELLAAETALQQARSQRDKARSKLHLLGFDGPLPAEGGKSPSEGRPLLPLVAPFGGTLVERQITEGQLVEPGFAAFRLADLSTVWVLLDVPETEAGRVRAAQEVTLEAVGENGRMQKGRVAYVGEVIDDQTRTVKVRVELADPDRLFRPGMFVTARITIRREGSPAIQLPSGAVFLLEDTSVVFVEGSDGIRPRPVKAEHRPGGRAVIRQGLSPGEKVVTEGGFALKAHILKSKMGEE